MQKVLRAVFYFSGLIILSLGIILNTKSAFGVTPIISIAYCLSLLHGCVTATLLIGLLSAGHPVGVGVGTIAAMIQSSMPFNINVRRISCHGTPPCTDSDMPSSTKPNFA